MILSTAAQPKFRRSPIAGRCGVTGAGSFFAVLHTHTHRHHFRAMEPFPGAVVHDTHQSSPGEVSRGIVVVEIPDNTGNDCANASFGAQDNTGALSPRDIEMAGAKEEKTTDVSLAVATKP